MIEFKPFKIGENAVLFLRCLHLFLTFGHAEKRLDKKAKVSFKIMTLQTRQKIVTIHILFYISRSIGKKKRKFSQLIEYNMKNIFLEKLYDCGGEVSPRLRLSISLYE